MRKRLRTLIDHLNYRGFLFVGTAYLTAASLIGFEALAIILGYATAFPVAAPALVLGIALWVVVRRAVSRRPRRRLEVTPRAIQADRRTDDGDASRPQ